MISSFLPSGTRYVAIHYTADEDKCGDWAAKASAGVPIKEWEREMELREDVYDGEAVHADYDDAHHSADDLTPDPKAILIAGWDCGQTLRPAFVLLSLSGQHVECLLEVVSVAPMPMQSFAPLVKTKLEEWRTATSLPPLQPGQIRHYGDATVTTRSGCTGETAGDIARRFGFAISPVSNDWSARYSAVAWLLSRRTQDGKTLFRLSKAACPILRKGFLGAYQFPVAPTFDRSGPGMVLRMPVKNAFSHPQDALQYAAVMVQRMVVGTSVKVTRYRS